MTDSIKAEQKDKDSSAAATHKKLSDLISDAHNANRGTERGAQMIQDSLRDYGAGRSILLDKHGRIIAGNKTAENAGAAGFDDVLVVQTHGEQLVAVQRMDLDLEADPKAKALAIADNRASQVSLDWNPDALKALLDDGVDLAPFWSHDELEALWPAPQLQKADDDVPDAPKVPLSQPGDLYRLGMHRLLCGSAADGVHVERLMGGQVCVAMWTDPPYGVDYVGKTKNALTIQNDSAVDLEDLLRAAFKQADRILLPGSAVYVAHPAGLLSILFGRVYLENGWRLHQTLVWDKGTMVLGYSDYQYAHEPILYGFTPDSDKVVRSEGDYHEVHEPIFYGFTPAPGRHGRGGKGWYGDNSQRSLLVFPKPSRSDVHPTMKPVALVESCLANSSKPGDAVYDPFGGSGSTLIACEKMRRRCFMMELSPAYCDVIVKRWEEATGQKAVLDGCVPAKETRQ